MTVKVRKNFHFWQLPYGNELKSEIQNTSLTVFQKCFLLTFLDEFYKSCIIYHSCENYSFENFCWKRKYISESLDDPNIYILKEI